MAKKGLLNPPSDAVSLLDRLSYFNRLRTPVVFCVLLLCSLPVRAQLQQPFVFAPDATNPNSIDVYTRNDLTGFLTPVPGSPFPSRQAVNVMALDFKGRFLFTASYNPSKVSMFTVDPNTGALQEVQASPFASSFTNNPVFLSTESSGQTLFVINFNSSRVDTSSLESFQIQVDTVTPAQSSLNPSPGGATLLPALFLTGATHLSGKTFYAFLTIPNVSIPNEAVSLVFDSSTGAFTAPAFPAPISPSSEGVFRCCLALDPQGQRLALGISDSLLVYNLNSDGTLSNSFNSNFSGSANSMSFDPLGQFLYVQSLSPGIVPPDRVHIFPIASLQETVNSPLPSGFAFPSAWSVDTTGPLLYANQVYQVDAQTGIPASILSTSPVNSPNDGVPPAIFSRPPGSQPIVGPTALLSAMSLSFGSLPLRQPSGPQTLTILSNGGQALSLNSFTFTGANPADFSLTSDTCHVPSALPPGQSCSALISFTPTAPGTRTAAFTITDNASPPMESVQLNGSGLNPAPAVSLMPASLDFGTVTQGTSAALSIAVKNSGTSTLHISSVLIAGANVNDFSSSSPTCTAPLSANSSCTINVTFTPLAAGLRAATVTLTDDAPDSPQAVKVQGNATAARASAVVVNPGIPDFGTKTQGTSTPMNVTVTNAGTTVLHITNAVLGGANANEFTLADPTCNTAIAASGSCTIVLTFTPLSVGAHSAIVTLTDDTPGSPQIINITGMAGAAFTPGPAPGGSTSASVSAGQSAQYLLQLNPGAGFSGTVSLACSGAPLNATCQVPSSVTIANGVPAPFTVTVSTAGSAGLPPSMPRHFSPPARIHVLQVLVAALLLVSVTRNRLKFDGALRGRRLASTAALTVMLLSSAIYAAGCGSSTSAVTTTPPPLVTPSGTSTIIITMTAMSPTQQRSSCRPSN